MNAASPSQTSGIRGRHVLISMIAFFGVIVVADSTMIYKAVTTFGGVDNANAYRDGLAYNDRISRAKRQAALGWGDTVTLSEDGSRLHVAMTAADGKPLVGLSIEATIGRPATMRADMTVRPLGSLARGLRSVRSCTADGRQLDRERARRDGRRRHRDAGLPDQEAPMGRALNAFAAADVPEIRRASPTDRPARPTNVSLVVEDMHCGVCMTTIERALRRTAGVREARVNLSTRRVSIGFDPDITELQALVDAIAAAGFKAAEAVEGSSEQESRRADDILRRLGVSGFAAANVMLLSVSVWAGAASDMEQAAASALFHWLSALIAMPAIAYSAQPFFRSAKAAICARRLNMDVPISLGITLAAGMSLFQTFRGSHQVYFDAAIMLTFFLLIGRYLDEHVRLKARGAAEELDRPEIPDRQL